MSNWRFVNQNKIRPAIIAVLVLAVIAAAAVIGYCVGRVRNETVANQAPVKHRAEPAVPEATEWSLPPTVESLPNELPEVGPVKLVASETGESDFEYAIYVQIYCTGRGTASYDIVHLSTDTFHSAVIQKSPDCKPSSTPPASTTSDEPQPLPATATPRVEQVETSASPSLASSTTLPATRTSVPSPATSAVRDETLQVHLLLVDKDKYSSLVLFCNANGTGYYVNTQREYQSDKTKKPRLLDVNVHVIASAIDCAA